jgi:hypothetical protein
VQDAVVEAEDGDDLTVRGQSGPERGVLANP